MKSSISRKFISSLGLVVIVGGLLVGVLALALKTYRHFKRYPVQPCEEMIIGQTSVCTLLNGMHFYYGNLHAHTSFSDGVLTPGLTFAWARDISGYDFYAITDHQTYLSDAEWENLGKQAQRFTENGKFIALRGFEWTPPGGEHSNVYHTATRILPETKLNLPDFYQWVAANQGFAQFNHPGAHGFKDLAYSAPGARAVWAIETGNKARGNNLQRYLPLYQKALDLGWLLAPTNNQDTHAFLTELVNSHKTVIIAPNLTQAALFEAMQQRRVYSSDDPNLKVIFKLGAHWMGSVVPITGNSVTLTIYLEDDEPLTKVEIISKHGQVVLQKDFNTPQVVWEPTLPVTADTFFYLKITEHDSLYDDISQRTQVTVSAPIWVTLKN